MDAPLNQVFFPSGFPELFTAWGRFPEAVPYAGGTGLIWGQGKQILRLPKIILYLDKIEELRKITRTERYLEIGAMVKLNQIMQLGKIVPDVLRQCMERISSPQLRNIATIGGNICFPSRRLDTAAPLVALDAQYELRNAHSSRWISAARFYSTPGPTAINKQELLTRIRIPLEQWNYPVYKKFSSTENSGRVVVFMIKNQKNALSDIRMVYKASGILRNRISESLLTGKHLPLTHKDTTDFMENWDNFLREHDQIDEISRKKLLNFIDLTISALTA